MALAFDIAGPIAMFRRPYTTTSSVSFPLPPPTAVAGLIGAIVGLNNGSDEVGYAAKYWDAMGDEDCYPSNPISGFQPCPELKELKKSPIRVKHHFKPKYHLRPA